jgi:hypothetical protein
MSKIKNKKQNKKQSGVARGHPILFYYYYFSKKKIERA